MHRELGNLLEEFSTLALSSEQPEKTTNNFKKPGILDFAFAKTGYSERHGGRSEYSANFETEAA
ncbi:hypothetical protein F3H15_35660 [Pseudomonas aeruginosa]|nr:hypothetical protein F3H15_35660 [Pseudomonas aeruginosa]